MCGQLHFEYIPLQSDRFVLYVCVRVFVRPASEVFRCVVYIVHRCSFSHSFSKSGGKQQRDSNKIFQRKHRLFDVFLLFRSFASCWCRCRCRCLVIITTTNATTTTTDATVIVIICIQKLSIAYRPFIGIALSHLCVVIGFLSKCYSHLCI